MLPSTSGCVSPLRAVKKGVRKFLSKAVKETVLSIKRKIFRADFCYNYLVPRITKKTPVVNDLSKPPLKFTKPRLKVLCGTSIILSYKSWSYILVLIIKILHTKQINLIVLISDD